MPRKSSRPEKLLPIYRGLVEVSALINSITEYDVLLQAVLDVARRVMQAEAASLFLKDEVSGDLRLTIASFGREAFVRPEITVPSGKGIVGWACEHGESLLVKDAYADPRFFAEADKATGFRTRSILCAPLRSDGRVFGVIEVLNPEGKRAFEPEDEEGFTAYADLISTAIEKLKLLERNRQRERVERDIEIAREIQSELLAQALPEKLALTSFAAYNQPAAAVGGDFYFVMEREPSETYFALGDVSGKGIPAALFMAQVLSLMTFVFRTVSQPAEALSLLNETVFQRIVRGMFVTALVGRLDARTLQLDLASAGHYSPWLLRERPLQVACEPGPPLGVLETAEFPQTSLQVKPREWILAFTDGLLESRDPAESDFSETLPLRIDQPWQSPQAVIETLRDAEIDHRRDLPLRDDLTILCGGLAG